MPPMLRNWVIRMSAGHEAGDLPARVKLRIREQQAASEILVGWIQLGVVVSLGTLYALAPKTFPPGAIQPVPWALGAYVAFTLLRLALAYRRALTGWFKAVSAVVDILLLLGLMWSFHIQYMQPPAFVLKAPTLLYVFVFIALRALLFEPAMVVLTGVAAALGWLGMLVYVRVADSRADLVTHDYVRYLTSNSLLVGAEVDKIVAILVVTGLIALAMWRARRLLVRSVAEGIKAHDLARFFAPEIAQQIVGSESEIMPGRGTAREAAILFVDIRNFTRMVSDLPPGDLIQLLVEYQSRLVPSIQAHRGTAEKFLGDGMMATFGAVVGTDTYAVDAIRAAEGILTRIEAWNVERGERGDPPIGIGIAISVGHIVSGAVGGEARLEYAVVGHTVNLAAKLEKHNKVESSRALCTREAYERALGQGYAPAAAHEHRPRRAVAGVPDTVDLVILAS